MTQRIVFVIDDDPGVRQSTKANLEIDGYEVKTYESADAFFNTLDDQVCGCIVSDVLMPGMSGLDLQRRLAGDHPGLALVLMSGHGDVPTAVEAMRHGAFDFIEKPYDPDQLIGAVERAFKSLSEDAGKDRVELPPGAREKLDQLTEREREILDHVVQGKTNKAIAFDLDLSQRTVEAHRANIKRKLGVNGLAELISLVRPE